MGRGFGKLDEDSESSVELRTHGAGNTTLVPNGGGAEWSYGSDIPSYSMAAATPAKAGDVVADERDIVVRREVHVTAERGGQNEHTDGNER